jgi:hypothetical protein
VSLGCSEHPLKIVTNIRVFFYDRSEHPSFFYYEHPVFLS